jgi:hypothetical protein
MRAVAKIDDKQIGEMTLDITFRMTVTEWRMLKRDLPGAWPSTDVARCISAVLDHVYKATNMTFTEPFYEADDDAAHS